MTFLYLITRDFARWLRVAVPAVLRFVWEIVRLLGLVILASCVIAVTIVAEVVSFISRKYDDRQGGPQNAHEPDPAPPTDDPAPSPPEVLVSSLPAPPPAPRNHR